MTETEYHIPAAQILQDVLPLKREVMGYSPEFIGRCSLSGWQISQAINLISLHPALEEEEGLFIRNNFATYYALEGIRARIFNIRYGIAAAADLFHFVLDNPIGNNIGRSPNPYSLTVEKTLKKLTGTRLYFISTKQFANPTNLPVELQIALEKGNHHLYNRIQDTLINTKGVLAFMAVDVLPPKLHDAIHELTDAYGGAAEQAISEVLKDLHGASITSDDSNDKLFPIKNIIRDQAKKLTHISILPIQDANGAITDIDTRLNDLLNTEVDGPYAFSHYMSEVTRGDVDVATVALFSSTAIAIILHEVGLGGSDSLIEAGKDSLTFLMADIFTNMTAAYPHIKKNQPRREKIKELLVTLFKEPRYRNAIIQGAVGTYILALTSEQLKEAALSSEGFNALINNLLSALSLSLSPLVPTYLTTHAAQRYYDSRGQKHQVNGQLAVESHPVQGVLMKSSQGTAVATFIMKILGLDKIPIIYTAVTEALEAGIALILAKAKLDEISKFNPVRL